MKQRKFLSVFVCLLMVVTVFAVVTPVNLVAEEPDLPEEPGMEGEGEWWVEGNGTYFELTNSTYLNITLTSSENIHLYLESIPRMISYHIERICTADSTDITISGFEASTTYYRYKDGNLQEEFTTDGSGTYTYTQDISTHHHVFIQETESTIYIDPDGNIVPSTAPISRDGDTYTLTANIYESIYIQKSGITLNGARHTVQGSGGYYAGYGIYLNQISGVTITNFPSIRKHNTGIYLYYSSGCLINNNNIKDNYRDIYLVHSSSNTISDNVNHISSDSDYGIVLSSSDNCIVSGNELWYDYYTHKAIYLEETTGNIVTGNWLYGINVYEGEGISLRHSDSNTISDNYVSGFYRFGISLLWSNSNVISVNTMSDNSWGIEIYRSNSNTVQDNSISGSSYGLYLGYSHSNTIRRNTVSGNTYGVRIQYSSNSNSVYHNIIDNINQAVDTGVNTWDDGAGEGNYWSDYGGVDLDADGIGDTPYIIDADSQDNYPLMNPYNTFIGTNVEVYAGFGVTVHFSEVTKLGFTSAKLISGSPPQDFRLIPTQTLYKITTTASYKGAIYISISYDDLGILPEEENNLKLKYQAEVTGMWIDITKYVDTENNVIYAETNHLLIFGIMLYTLPIFEGNIIILSDGTLDPIDAPLSVSLDGQTYTHTMYISGSITIQKSAITLDGAGYFVVGSGTGNGIYLNGISDVTIQNLNINGFNNGIKIDNSNSITINSNNIINNNYGILSSISEYITINNNLFSDNPVRGVQFYGTSNSLVKQNIMTFCGGTIYMDPAGASNEYLSSNNEISMNDISNGYGGVNGWYCTGIKVLDNTIMDNSHHGIFLGESDGSTLRGNTVERAGSTGIYIHASDNVVIDDNDVSQQSWLGIYVSASSNTMINSMITITNNRISHHVNAGIAINNMEYVTITGNTIEDNNRGINYEILFDGELSHFTIDSNVISNNQVEGIRLSGGLDGIISHGTITNNNVFNNGWGGIALSGITDFLVRYNQIWGNTNYPGLAVWSGGDVAIEYNEITDNIGPGPAAMVSAGIHTGGRHISISNNNILRNGCGIVLKMGEYITVANNLITDNVLRGVQFYGTSNSIVRQNTIVNSGTAVYFWTSGANEEYWSLNNEIIENEMSNGGGGVYGLHSQGTKILDNTILDNSHSGILLLEASDSIIRGNTVMRSGYTGIMTYSSDNVVIDDNYVSDHSETGIKVENSLNTAVTENTVSLSDLYGIHLSSSDFGTITLNTIMDNDNGIYITDSSGNLIYYNNILNNIIQAYDSEPANNHWHNPDLLEGNYWSDYLGYDDGSGTEKHAIAEDGIGDTEIPHPDINYDFYPFTNRDYWLNQPPVITSITGPIDPIPINTGFIISGTFEDPDSEDIHTATWYWGDNTESSGDVDDRTVTGSNAYTIPGVYTITLTVEDAAGESDTEICEQYVVAYDPNGAFVTGGGRFDSPPGAFPGDLLLTGEAGFGFVSKYQKGATTPDGNTQFRFKAGDISFHSTSYDWMVCAGPKAMFKGTGEINGEGNYGFLISAIDGDMPGGGGVDKFRIKIWDKDNLDTVVYDNGLGDADDANPGTPLTHGSIKIHKA